MVQKSLKPVRWVPPSYEDLVTLPRDVQHAVGLALMMAQGGGKHPSAKPLELGGPPVYVERFGHPMLRARHLPFRIGEEERDAWIWCMSRALDHPDVPAELASFLRERLGAMADHMRNAPGGGG